MQRRTRTSIVGGLLLILIGAWFLVQRFYPEASNWLPVIFAWPMWIIGAGVMIFILGLLTGGPGLSVPAFLISGIGTMLYWQNATGNWRSWAYTWTLIPGLVGLGTIVAGLLGEHPRVSRRDGGRLILISLVLFILFFAFFGGVTDWQRYWPVLIILIGLWIAFGALIRGRSR